MCSLGMPELIILFGIILLLFGAKKLPELARGLGRGIREFKDATNEITDEINKPQNRPDSEIRDKNDTGGTEETSKKENES